jgi:hypothetical protein
MDAVTADQMRKFVLFVEQPGLQAIIKQLQEVLHSLSRSHQASLSSLKDRYVEKEQALTDAVSNLISHHFLHYLIQSIQIVQIRKSIISLQIQSVAGGGADVNALRQRIVEEGARVLDSMGDKTIPSLRFDLPAFQCSDSGKVLSSTVY